jgi:hypothetical protein
MAKAALLEIDIVAKADKALGEFDKIKSKATDSNKALATGAAVAAGAILGALGAATKAAADHEVAISKLNVAYADAGLSAAGMADDISGIEASARRTGQGTEDLIAAYSKLVIATEDSGKAHRELAIAQDLAAFKGMSVADATGAVIKVGEGATKGLKAMGLAIADTGDKSRDAAINMDTLERAVSGQADAFGDTAAGKMARYRESLDQTKVAIGEALIPVLTRLLDTLAPVFEWLTNNQEVLQALAPIIAVAAGAVVAITVAMKIWTAVQWALNIAMGANPIGAVIIAIGLLIAAVALVILYWDDFRAAIDAVWQGLQWLWDMILNIIAAIGNLVSAIPNALGALGGAFGGAWDFITSPFELPPPGPAPQPIYLSIVATPGDDLPETVYQALREYQRRHVRAELAPAFGPARR